MIVYSIEFQRLSSAFAEETLRNFDPEDKTHTEVIDSPKSGIKNIQTKFKLKF